MSALNEKAKEFAKRLGLKVENWSDEVLEELAAKKEEMDAETRRKTRAFWAPMGFAVGGVVGFLVAVMM